MRNTRTVENTYDPYREGTLPSLEREVQKMKESAKEQKEIDDLMGKIFKHVGGIAMKHNAINRRLTENIKKIKE